MIGRPSRVDDKGLVAASDRVAELEARIDDLLQESRSAVVPHVDALIDATEELIRERRTLLELRRVAAERPFRRVLVLTLGVQPILALAVLMSAITGIAFWNIGVVALVAAGGFAAWLVTREIPPSWRNCLAASAAGLACVAATLAAAGAVSLWWLLATVPAWMAGAAWLHDQALGRSELMMAVMRRG